MTNAEIDRLDCIFNALPLKPWSVSHIRGDDIERFTVVGGLADTICTLEEGEPGDFDDEAREQIAATFNFIAEVKNSWPAIVAELRRHRADDAIVVG